MNPKSLVVISPHLDDAAFSIGGLIWQHCRAGWRVQVVTVFGNDCKDLKPAQSWDRRGGFATVGQAAAARRREELRACDIMGAQAVVLPFPDESNVEDRDISTIAAALRNVLSEADLVLLPGAPLAHADHKLVTSIVRGLSLQARIEYYQEQPYAAIDWLLPRHYSGSSAPVVRCFSKVPLSWGAWLARQRSVFAYGSQWKALGVGALACMLLYQTLHGSEYSTMAEGPEFEL